MGRAWMQAGAVALAVAAAPADAGDVVIADPGDVVNADADDVVIEAAGGLVLDAAGPRPAADERGGVDLAAHVDVNVVLPENQWRVAGGLQNLVVAAGGRLVLEGNLTIGGPPVGATPERIRRTDETVLARLRDAQRDRLVEVAADRRIPADRRRALALATEVDIRRVMTDVARLRDRYVGRRASLGDDAWRSFQADVRACRRGLADPFGADSLFAAVRAELTARADD